MPRSLITDEMVDRAAVAFYRENRQDPTLSLHEQSRKAMRAALEAVEGDFIEEFGASGFEQPRGEGAPAPQPPGQEPSWRGQPGGGHFA